jgi:hypothetical protein
MIIVAFADIHDNIKGFDAVAEDLSAADTVVLIGDLTDFGRQPEAARVVKAARRYNDRILAVPGNCDYPEVDAYLVREGISVHRRGVVIDGVAFLGVGGSLPCPGKTPNEFSEEHFKAFLAEAASGLPPAHPLVLVTHQPPLGTVTDRVRNGRHVGSESVRLFIEHIQPVLCLTGHIHEGRGMDTIGRTPVVNPGPLSRGGYVYARIGQRLEELEIRGQS